MVRGPEPAGWRGAAEGGAGARGMDGVGALATKAPPSSVSAMPAGAAAPMTLLGVTRLAMPQLLIEIEATAAIAELKLELRHALVDLAMQAETNRTAGQHSQSLFAL